MDGRTRASKGADGATSNRRVAKPKLPAPEDLQRIGPGEMTAAATKWAEMLKSRGISLETAERNGLAVQSVYSPIASGYVDALCFPYMRDGELINIKYRGPDKTFWQVKGAEKILYGLDDVTGEEEVILVEGEMDKLALEEAGFKNVVSVPDGAPGKVKDGPTPAPEEDKKYEYLWNCRAQLDTISRFVIATDSDGPGQALSEELARRLGKERCWRVTWPEGCKDANEALQKEGADVVRECLTTAEGFPLRGLFRFSEFAPEIESYFNMTTANELRGVSTGWRNIDNNYRIVPGELTVVTGVPNSGKSEWVDALMCNLAVQHGWSFALCSLENKVHEHARKLVEKYVGEPWFEGKYSKAPRMNPDTMRSGMKWLNEHFVLIRHEDDELPSVDWILGLARAAVLRHGIRGLLIDPYNELDHKRPTGQTETEYVSQMLTRIKRFAQHYDVHVWFVAHPRQLHNWKGEAPGLYDISGSAHFINKCDNGIVVHRNRDEKLGSLREVTINVQKVRNKVAGSIGDPKLEYNVSNGRYVDI
jgi:twinkle protein